MVAALARAEDATAPLRTLAGDPDALDRLLDTPALFDRLLAAPHLLRVSPWFFYYVVVRRTLLDHGIEDRVVADYVGALLSFYLQRRAERHGETVHLVDLVQAMAGSRSAEEAFRLQTAIGDRALYLAGVFPDWVHHRHTYGRRPVDLEYYEAMGRSHYAAAARTDVARQRELGDVLETLAGAFPRVRQALNDLVDEHLHMAPRPATVDALCRQALFRVRN